MFGQQMQCGGSVDALSAYATKLTYFKSPHMIWLSHSYHLNTLVCTHAPRHGLLSMRQASAATVESLTAHDPEKDTNLKAVIEASMRRQALQEALTTQWVLDHVTAAPEAITPMRCIYGAYVRGMGLLCTVPMPRKAFTEFMEAVLQNRSGASVCWEPTPTSVNLLHYALHPTGAPSTPWKGAATLDNTQQSGQRTDISQQSGQHTDASQQRGQHTGAVQIPRAAGFDQMNPGSESMQGAVQAVNVDGGALVGRQQGLGQQGGGHAVYQSDEYASGHVLQEASLSAAGTAAAAASWQPPARWYSADDVPQDVMRLLQHHGIHEVKHVTKIGRQGVSPELCATLLTQMAKHPLLKIKATGKAAVDRKRVVRELEEGTSAIVIHASGSTMVLFRGYL